MKNKVALIFGITGQDGSYLAQFLLKKKYIVHGVKRRSSSLNTGRVDHMYQDPHERTRKFILHYGDVTDAISVSSDLLFIAHETGLLRYTYGSNSLVNIIPGEQFSKLKYDQLNGTVLASIGNELRYYTTLGSPLGVVNHTGLIHDFYLYYNK